MQYVYIIFILLLLAPGQVYAAEQKVEGVLAISPAALPIKYDNVVEIVTIGNERYQVPPPWAGNRLFPTSRNLDELQQIPREFTYQGSEIYILAEAFPALVKMIQRAQLDGIDLRVESAYRSINYQRRIFTRMMSAGRSFADIIRYVAPPGYSQHMLGTAMDFYPSNWEFAETDQYKWLQEHGAEFGFEETYSQNNRFRMPWEAWHWNYTGRTEDLGSVAEGIRLEPDDEVSN